jgi:two-component system, cell cycle sensor histidine kinase and response regulator CckA
LAKRSIPRFLAIAAASIVALHVLSILTFGSKSVGPLFGNLLQVSASFLAAYLSFRAARKISGFSRSFWTLVAFSMAIWGIANLGWTYFEIFLHIEPPPGSMIRFLFDTHGMFFVMALFLNQENSDSNVDVGETLDFLQIGILFFLVYFVMYFLAAETMGPKAAIERENDVMIWGHLGVLLLAFVQWRRARLPMARQLYRGLAIYFLIYAVLSNVTEVAQVAHEIPTGTWLDLGWTIPLLCGASWAGTWEPTEQKAVQNPIPSKSLFGILLSNGLFVFAPLLILYQVAQLGPGWRLLRFTLLSISFSCYALRIGLTQFRQHKDEETVRRQTLAMDSSMDGISILNEKGVHIYANTAFARMLGVAGPEQIVGLPWRKVYSLQAVDRLQSQIRNSLQQSAKWSSPLLLDQPDGRCLSVDFSITAMPDGSIACVCRDLSERQEAEKARAEAETKYRMLVEHVNAITYIAEIGIHGRWFYVSPQVESILGYTSDEWLGIAPQWDKLIHPDDLPAVIAAEETSKSGFPFQAEFRLRRKDGREVWLSDTAVVVQGSNTHPVMEGIMVDITERKVLETQLQQSRKMEAVGRLAGGIAHDFNNLLTIITGYTDLALSRASMPLEIRSDIERIDNASGRAAALVRQLLAFSRKQVLQPRTIDLNEVVLNLDKLLRRLMDDNIAMETHTQRAIGKVKADPAQIEQVIMNLVVNARDAMPGGGRIVLETSNVDLDSAYADEHVSVKPGKYVMLAVSDNGIGMSQQTLAHIFEPFYTTKDSGSGTGLGLSTVYGIVKQSGGYIWVYSEVGEGSTFKVYLPRVENLVEQPETLPSSTEQTQRGWETILLVEDEEAVRELIRTVLIEHGYDVLPARDPEHAMKLVTSYAREIHMLLTDVIMPGMSGRELANNISVRRPGIRILFMSGYTNNVITTGGMLEKGLAFLQKPFSPSTLINKVRDVLTSAPAPK